ncbi:MAG: FixH family protein [Pontibacterium sp.]
MTISLLKKTAAIALLLVPGMFFSLALTPAQAADKPQSFDQQSARQVYQLSLRPSAPPVQIGKIHSWDLTVKNQQGQPVHNARISIDGGMLHHGHGLPTKPRATPQDEPGLYRLEGMKFSMDGAWVIDLVITVNGLTDSARFNLNL